MGVTSILYQFYLYAVPLGIAGAMFGMRWKEGLWGNVLSIFAVFFSALIAVSWWEPLAVLFAENVPKALYLADFISLWILFIVSLLIISEITRALSRVKVQFAEPVEKAGNAVALVLLTVALLGFYKFSEDISPVGEHADATVSSNSIQVSMFKMLSEGNLSSFTNPIVFNGDGMFRQDHLKRRQALMVQMKGEGEKLFYEGSVPPKKR